MNKNTGELILRYSSLGGDMKKTLNALLKEKQKLEDKIQKVGEQIREQEEKFKEIVERQ
jgi:hypothetical protein